MYRVRSLVVRASLVALICILSGNGGLGDARAASGSPPKRDVPFVSTPHDVVQKMLEMADVGANDIVYDLGSGDGRIAIAAVKDFGAKKAVGIDIDPRRINESRGNAEAADVTDKVAFIEGNLFEFDFSEATVVTMYLLPRVNVKLRPKILSTLEPGTRVVSHDFDMGEWKPDRQAMVAGSDVLFWIVPARVEGTWQWQSEGQDFHLDLKQEFQNVIGKLRADGDAATISQAELDGPRFRFDTWVSRDGKQVPVHFDGRVGDGVINATIMIDGKNSKITARPAD